MYSSLLGSTPPTPTPSIPSMGQNVYTLSVCKKDASVCGPKGPAQVWLEGGPGWQQKSLLLS